MQKKGESSPNNKTNQKPTPEQIPPPFKAKMTPEQTTAFRVGKDEGLREGLVKGKEEGWGKGFEKGREEGVLVSRKAGYKDGYKQGEEKTYPIAYHNGKAEGRLEFVNVVEEKLAESAGYKDRDTWRKEAVIPAWWIAALITFWKGSTKVPEGMLTKVIKTPEKTPHFNAGDESGY